MKKYTTTSPICVTQPLKTSIQAQTDKKKKVGINKKNSLVLQENMLASKSNVTNELMRQQNENASPNIAMKNIARFTENKKIISETDNVVRDENFQNKDEIAVAKINDPK